MIVAHASRCTASSGQLIFQVALATACESSLGKTGEDDVALPRAHALEGRSHTFVIQIKARTVCFRNTSGISTFRGKVPGERLGLE